MGLCYTHSLGETQQKRCFCRYFVRLVDRQKGIDTLDVMHSRQSQFRYPRVNSWLLKLHSGTGTLLPCTTIYFMDKHCVFVSNFDVFSAHSVLVVLKPQKIINLTMINTYGERAMTGVI